MRRTIQLLVGLAAAVAIIGCGGSKTPAGTTGSHPGTYGPGQTSFVSQAPGGGSRGGTAANDAAGGAASPGAGSTTGGTGNTGAGSSGGSSTPRTITEADIYKLSGSTLFVLNQYRGLQIVDVSDLAHPKLEGRVPVIGTPVDLYVEGTTAYVVVSDAFHYDVTANGGTAQPWIGSQVWAIDVSQPAAPHVLSVLPVDGEVEESRIVGNVLYVVSNVYSWYYWGYAVDGVGGGAAAPAGGGASSTTNQNLTYVQSFDISNPSAMSSVQRLDFPATGWEIHANVTESRIVLSESGYDNTSGQPFTQFAPIDISDASGKLHLGQTFQTSGRVQDRWAMDFDPSTGLFRAVLENDWGNSGGKLVLWNAPTVQQANQVGALALNLQEAVTAASFDGPRAYIVTAYCTDPLWIVDTTDPSNPRLRGSVQMSGALDFVLPRGNQLLALGHESNGCMAWEGTGQLAVSLFDVSNPDAPTMTSRVVFGAQYSYIDVKADDMKKAFQVLDNLNLILVPFQSWDQTNWTYAGGTQLIDYDASALTLTQRGFAEHAGDIKRAFPIATDKIAALSDRSLQVLDISNRDNPVETAALDLARPVISLAVVNNTAVELSGDWSLGDTYLVTTDAATPDQSTPTGSLKIPSPYARMFQDGTVSWILSTDYTNGTMTLQAVDVSNPASPTKRGSINLDPSQVGYGYGGWWYWGYGAEAQLVGHALVLHNAYWGCYGDCYYGNGSQQPQDQLWVVDLRNPDAPALASPITLTGSDWSWGLTESGGYAWITHYEWVGGGNYSWVRYYVDRLDVSDPANPHLVSKINVPGVFFAADATGNVIYTQDVTYDANWKPTTWLNKLMLLPNHQAQLLATVSLDGYPDGAVVNDGYAYLETWNWSSQSTGSLSTIELSSMTVKSSQSIGSQWSWLRKAAGGKLFAETWWYDSGVLVYDLSNPAQPQLQGTVRTNGWVYDIIISGNTAYLPSGFYGVPTLDLTPGAPLPTQVY